jgi:tetratricopeptide (TPR) repeat protein
LAEADVPQQIAQGRQLSKQGNQEGALEQFQKAVQAAPESFEAHLAMGTTLDLLGRYAEAQQHIRKSIEVAKDAEAKTQAARAMAVSFAFERKPAEAAKYEKQIFNSHLAAGNYTRAAEIGDELARIYLECGHLDQAYDWYQRAYNTALKKSGITAQDKDLWGFRWEAGQARVAARRGEKEVAAKEVIAAKAFVDRLRDPQQQAFVPYLSGYLAFYAKNYPEAITELKNANPKDLFVLDSLARAYERSGQASEAVRVSNDILKINTHNIANAFARPTAKRILGRQNANLRSTQ